MRSSWGFSSLALLAFAALFGCSDGKSLYGSFRISPTEREKRVHYMTKFACSIGECQYKVRGNLKTPWAIVKNAPRDIQSAFRETRETTRLVIRVVLDEEWEKSHDATPCERAEMGRGRTTIKIPLNGEVGPWATNTFRQTYRPHFWYFIAEDCKNAIADDVRKVANYSGVDLHEFEVHYETEIYQVGGGHLSFEYEGMIKWHVIHLITYGGLLGWMIWKQKRVMKSQRYRLHVMSQILNASCIGAIWGSIMHVVHLLSVDATGSSLPFLDGLADSCFTLSQIAISSCLILIAMGVTLNAPQRVPMPVITLIGVAIALVHLLAILTDKYVADSRYKYYASEGPVGWILIGFRLALWGIYLLCWQGTRTDPRTPGSTERFLRRTLVPSTAYFLTFPFIMALTSVCRPYWRHAFFFHATFVVNIVSVFWLAEVFLNKGEYFRVSTMSQSFLPGGVWRPTMINHRIE